METPRRYIIYANTAIMMNANDLLRADVIDIVFDGRNKLYGAYVLRKRYPAHMAAAVAIVLLLACLTFFFKKQASVVSIISHYVSTDTVILTPVTPDPPPLRTPTPVNTVATQQYTAPLLVSVLDPEDNPPPTVDDLDVAKPGTETHTGISDVGDVLASGSVASIAVTEKPDIEPLEDDIVVEVADEPASFPGGLNAWRRFLERNLNYPNHAQDNGTSGIVRVRFIVDREGNISEVQALDNPGDGLAEEAVRIIKKGPKWKPARRNGRNVRYLHVQSINFVLE
jgi:protein TonB